MRRIYIIQGLMIALLAGFFFGFGSFKLSVASPGDSSDPLVTAAWVDWYVNGEFSPLENTAKQARQDFEKFKSRKHLVLFWGCEKAWVNGFEELLDAAPYAPEGHTYVPVRFIAENLDFTVEWYPEQMLVVCKAPMQTIAMQIGSTIASVQGPRDLVAREVSLPAAPYIANNRTMVPLRFISEYFGCQVLWDGDLLRIDVIKE
ncbi:MAG: copper amine oxidase N-terminal domain-containing protein [Clostridiales bacterium]|nr:copper amine oxidase N-terminal domain-containing protein [Clostridiales bacterium]